MNGITFYKTTHRDELIVDVDFEYAGDLVIEVEAVVLDTLPALKASLSNLTVTQSKLRLHVKPLLNESPFFGAIGQVSQ